MKIAAWITLNDKGIAMADPKWGRLPVIADDAPKPSPEVLTNGKLVPIWIIERDPRDFVDIIGDDTTTDAGGSETSTARKIILATIPDDDIAEVFLAILKERVIAYNTQYQHKAYTVPFMRKSDRNSLRLCDCRQIAYGVVVNISDIYNQCVATDAVGGDGAEGGG